MTMHYEFKGRHEVCFKAKIWRLSAKSFRLPCQVQRLEVSVVHVVDRVLHCTVSSNHLNYN